MNLKKILIVLIILFILSASALVFYNFFFQVEDKPSNGETAEETDFYPNDRIKTISQEPVLGITIDGQKVKYYLAGNGNAFESDFDGENQIRLSSNILTSLLEVFWSSDNGKVIVLSEENGLIKKYFYDYSTKTVLPLNNKMRWITWSPNTNQIAYQYYNAQNEDNNISIANPDGSKWNIILQTRMKNLIVEWPAQDKVSIRTMPSGLAKSVVYAISLPSNNLEKINEAYGMSILWSPLGNKILFSETDSKGKNLELKMMDLQKQTISELNFVTLPEKCVWSQDNRSIFCAIPKEISSSAVLPDDYYKNKFFFSDSIWRINLDNGEAIKIFEGGDDFQEIYDAQKLILSTQEDYLFFINKKNGLLYSLEL